MKIKKVDAAVFILLLILTILTIDFMIFEEHRSLITNIWDIENLSTIGLDQMGLRISIVFIVCLVGNLSPLPSPYTWSVCLGFAYFSINPLLTLLFGIVASFGCLIGEITGYYIGRGAEKVISEERKDNLKDLQVFLVEHPKIAPFLIFLFGLTPLNDDFLTIPLGILKYDVKKTIIFCWLGKLGLMLLFAFNLFGICGILGGESWILSIAGLYAIVLMIYIMLRVNVAEFLKHRLKQKEKQ